MHGSQGRSTTRGSKGTGEYRPKTATPDNVGCGPVIRKRSVMLRRHATSVSLEDEYWDELRRMAKLAKISLGQLIARIDAARSTDNLSSALRLAVLADLKNQPTARR